MLTLVVSAFFTLEKDGQNVDNYTVQIILSGLNLLMLTTLSVFLEQIYTKEIAFIDNSLAREQSYINYVIISQKVLLMVTLFASAEVFADPASHDTFAITLIPISSALAFFEVFIRVFKMKILKLSKIISGALQILVSSIMFIAFVYSGVVLHECKSFFVLMWYSLLLSIFYTMGFYFLYLYQEKLKFKALLGKHALDENKWAEGLSIAFSKLRSMIEKGTSAAYLMDLLLMVSEHSKLCKDIHCVCKQKRAYLKQIHKSKLTEMESSELLNNNEDDIDNEQAFQIEMTSKLATYEDKQKHLLIEFIISFLLMLTKKALKQFPSSLELTNIGLNIIFTSHNSNKLVAQFLLINLNTKQQKSADRLHYLQLQLLLDDNFQKNSAPTSLKIDPDDLINHHILQRQLKDGLNDLSEETSRFWNLFKNQQFNVEQISGQQNMYASTIIKIQKLLAKLEQSNQDKIYTLYMQSLMQRLIFNDLASSLNYLKKLQSFTDMNKLFQRMDGSSDIQGANFIIIDAQYENLGRILAANQGISLALGYDMGELEKSVNIEKLMPKVTRKHHFQLMKDMMQTGNGGKKFTEEGSNTFVVKKNNYVLPMNLKVKLIYTMEFELVYLAHFVKLDKTKLEEKDIESINYNDIMILLCEEKGLQITAISQTCQKYLELNNTLIQSSQFDTKSEFLSLYDIIDDNHAQLESFEASTSESQVTQNVMIDREAIRRLTHSVISKRHQDSDNKMACTIQIRKQVIYQDLKSPYKLPTFQIIVYIVLGQDQTTITSQGDNKINSSQRRDQDKMSLNEQAQQQMMIQMDEDNSSQDSTHTNSSNLNETPENIKQYLSSGIDNKVSSKSLNMVFRLVIFLFFVMFCIGIINLGLTLQRHSTQNKEIQIVKLSFDRLNYHAKVRVLLRNLVNMANGYEPLSSTYEKDRTTQIKTLLIDQLQQIKSIQDYLDSVINQHLYSFEMPVRMVQVQTLANDNNITSNAQTYSVAYHLYLSNTLTLLDKNFSSFKGKSNVQLIIPDYSKPPTDDEKLVTFCVLNSMGDIVLINWQEAQDYTAQSKQHSIAANNSNLLTTIISIVTIFVVGCIVTPMIAQFYKRRFQSLKYFLLIDETQLKTVLDNCDLFNHQLEGEIKAIKSIKNMMKRGPLNRGINNASSRSSQYNLDNQIQESIIFSSNNDQISSHSSLASQRLSENQSKQYDIQQEDESVIYQAKYQQNKLNFQASSFIGQSQDFKSDTSNQQSVSMYKFNNSSLNKKLKSQELSPSQKNKTGASSIQDDNDDDNQDQENKDELGDPERKKFSIFIQMAQRKVQIQAFLIIGIIIGIFALYFIGTYILALKAFNNAPEILENLKMIFSKDACIENAIAYVRDNEIINATTYLETARTGLADPVIASTYTLDQCMGYEDQYRNLRKDLPSYFERSTNLINAIEISQCTAVSINGLSNDECVSSFDGLLNVGYSQAIAVILSKFKQVDLKYFSNKDYSQKWITDIVQDMQQINLMEVNEFYIYEVAKSLKQSVVDSTLYYFSNLRQSYVIIFCFFILFMMVLMTVFLVDTFKRMQYQSLLTNQSFRVLPLEFVSKEDLASLKQFCQN